MRKLYLARHGEPLFLNNARCCIGRLDLDISQEGKRQAAALARYFSARPVTSVWCSPLLRGCRTAQYIAAAARAPVVVKEGLTEVAVGEWEGLTFAEIRQRWPEHYARRGKDPARIPPPGGEPFPQALPRFAAAVREILDKTVGDVAIVGHSGVNRAFLCAILDKDLEEMFDISQPYGCVNVIEVDDNQLTVRQVGLIPDAVPSEQDCQRLLDSRQAALYCIAHGQAVAAKAEAIFTVLPAAYQEKMDARLLRAAALLHDIAKGRPDHPHVGASWVEEAGYPVVADIIATHHWLNREQLCEITEHSILYLADKLVYGEREENLEQRFAASRSVCGTDQARLAHRNRYDQAVAVWKMIAAASGDGPEGDLWGHGKKTC